MNKHVAPQLNRRAFVIGTAAVGAGLAVGLDIPFGGPAVVRAADGSPEVNASSARPMVHRKSTPGS